jgi:hypothetical protein
MPIPGAALTGLRLLQADDEPRDHQAVVYPRPGDQVTKHIEVRLRRLEVGVVTGAPLLGDREQAGQVVERRGAAGDSLDE